MRKIFISAGEASGDLNGASLASAIAVRQPETKIYGMGGEMMRAAGVDIVYDIADLGVMGVVEVAKSLPKLFRLRDFLAAWLARERPDVLVVIDYPGFNTRLAKIAKNSAFRWFPTSVRRPGPGDAAVLKKSRQR